MKFTRITPGHYESEGGSAVIRRGREGSLYAHEIMWILEVDGEFVTNVGTLADAKAAAETREARERFNAAIMSSSPKLWREGE